MKGLLDYLDKTLKEPLPGQSAQELMMPSLSDKSRFSLNAKKDARIGAVMILFYEDSNQIKIPLIERPKYDGVHAGQISFPGGKHEQGDEDLIETALRETEEEIGIPVDKIEVIGVMSELYIIASNFNVLPVVGYIDQDFSFKKDEREVESIVEAEIAHLMDDSYQKETTLLVRDYEIQAPYFDIEGHVVWGATAMMLSELKMVLEQLPVSEWTK